MTVLLVGAGPTAVAYAKVLTALGRDFVTVGRGVRSAEAFREATAAAVAEGGLAAWLQAHGTDGLEAAIVVTPIPVLAEAAGQLIDAGMRRLLVEKPAGLDAAEIAAIDRRAASAGADVRVAYNRRFYASTRAARRLIAEDGGVSSFHFDFTEVPERILTPDKSPQVLANWFLGNSSHVVDLAFHLGGEPAEMYALVAGTLDWHPPGATFAGSGRTAAGTLFTWLADWSAPGRWGVDLRTPRRRLLMQPIEQLKAQANGSFALDDVALDDDLDRRFKPGFHRQVRAFLDGTEAEFLPTLPEHRRTVEQAFLPILGGGR